MAELTKKEKLFCLCFASWGDLAHAERESKLSGKGRELICRRDICDEIRRLSDIQSKCLKSVARAGLTRIALGSCADAVKLIFKDKPADEDIENLDLFMISEIRRKENSTEIKFFDRFKALEKLMDSPTDTEGTSSFYEALMKGADDSYED